MTRRVLVTREVGTWPALDARFAGTSIALQWTPTTRSADPIDPRSGDEALLQLAGCDWLVVTSGRGVAALARRLAARGAKGLAGRLRVAAVGPGTARALQAIGASVSVVGEDSGAEGLAVALVPRMTAGSRVLLVCPEGPRSELAAALRSSGAEVFEAPLYRTIASEHAQPLAVTAIAGEFAGVVFTAPSSLMLWIQAAGPRRGELFSALNRVRRIAIGATTANGLASAGLPADAIAEAPSESAVGDAILRALDRSTC